jgi:hypothetical protein
VRSLKTGSLEKGSPLCCPRSGCQQRPAAREGAPLPELPKVGSVDRTLDRHPGGAISGLIPSLSCEMLISGRNTISVLRCAWQGGLFLPTLPNLGLGATAGTNVIVPAVHRRAFVSDGSLSRLDQGQKSRRTGRDKTD